MAELFLNGIFATLSAGIDDTTTTLPLTTGHGARFGTIGVGNKVRIAFLDAALNVSEVVYMTAISGDSATITRAQDGTTAVAHLAGDRIEARIGKSTLESFAALSGASFTGLVNLAAGANIASAATVDLTAATGNCPRITGTTPTSAVTMNTGQQMLVVADGAWPLTYHATTNKITGGVDTTLAAGDHVLYYKDLSGVVSGMILRANPGETVSSYVTFASFAAVGSGVYTDHTSITVSPGKWRLDMCFSADINTGDCSAIRTGIGTVAGNDTTGLVYGDTFAAHTPDAANFTGGSISGVIVTVTAATTYYLKRLAVYTTTTPTFAGRLTATRIN